MHVHGQPLAGVEQLDEQLWVGAPLAAWSGPRKPAGSAATASRSSRPSASGLKPSSRSPKTVVVEPTHSSGVRSPASAVPRSAAIAAPPR